MVGIEEDAGATVFVALGFCIHGLVYCLPFLHRSSRRREKIMSITTKRVGHFGMVVSFR